MNKALKSLSLILFSICSILGFNLSADALTLDSDMSASDITIQSGDVIDGQNKYKITGGFNLKNVEDVTIKNVTLDGEGTKDILVHLTNAGDITIENVKFVNYTKAGIYAEAFKSLDVNNSSFDASDTVNIGDYPGNPEEELIKRSAAGIDLNIGNGAKYDINIDHINITNNEFKNVTDTATNSTAGAIKIKIKDESRVQNIGTTTISNNTFTDNVRDLVIGTDSPSAGTEQSKTGDLNILLQNNSAMKIVNNSKDGASETLEGNYKLNYAQDIKYELDNQMFYKISKDDYAALDETSFYNLIKTLKNDENILGVVIENDNYTVSFKTSDINLDGLQVLEPIKFNITDTTNIEDLKDYQKDGVKFITTNANNANISNLTLNITLDEKFNTDLYLYSYAEDNLELISNLKGENNIVSINLNDLKENYILSNSKISENEQTTPSNPDKEETTSPSDENANVNQSENTDNIKNPQTYDPFTKYLVLCLTSLITLAGTAIYIKKRVLN